MEPSELLPRLEQAVPGAVLEARPFGRQSKPRQELSVWIEMRSIQKVAAFLRSGNGLDLDWLEALTWMEIEGAIVLTYFLRSRATGASVVVRGSIEATGSSGKPQGLSVRRIWPEATQFEDELAELAGVEFGEPRGLSRLAVGVAGYPLRKSFVFPKEVAGIIHSRPVGRSGTTGRWKP